ncbi:hypothetical protein [Streptomyces sp. NPDC059008]|uniref:hypothetical protein n=1 Tax=Streptomyces sp. NPDC059008 TaxID=3346693 RepID=UPI003674764F
MAFRTSISLNELREKRADQDDSQHATTYEASRGGWYPKQDSTPVPGAGNGSNGRLRGGR